MNKNPFNNCISTNEIPDYILGLDENDVEYIVHLGSSYPCLIRINDIISEEQEDENEDEEEYGDTIDNNERVFVDPTFDIEVFKITEKGLKQIGYEKSLKPVKNIIKLGLDFYIKSNT
jgi:hypothetical protein